MSDIGPARQALIDRVLNGDGTASPAWRRGAFDNTGLPAPLATFIDKVAKHASKVTDEDVAVALESGLSEDQVFELVVCAAIGQATRGYDAAVAALDAAARRD